MTLEERNVATVTEFYDALLANDLPAILEMVAEDVELEVYGPPEVPFAGTRRGREGVEEFFRIVSESVARDSEDLSPEFHEFIAQREKVVALGRDRVRCKGGSGIYDSWWIHVFTVREGKLVRMQEFIDSAASQAVFSTPAPPTGP